MEQLLACQSGAVAIVTVINQRPVLSQGENYIFTEYKVELNEVIKGGLAADQRATITQIGGMIDLPGDRMSFAATDTQPLVVGNTYLAFLEHLPATNDYAVIAVYEIRPGGTLRAMKEGSEGFTAARSAQVLATVRAMEPCAN
jgi:hypothetical protein